jgi:predicted PurR-regulated permease PerM
MARWLLVLASLYGVGWLAVQAFPALIPFIIGLVLAYLLSPVVNRLNAFMPRWLAILLVYIGGIALIVVAIRFIVPPVVNQIEQAITNVPDMDKIRAYWQEFLQQYQLRVPEAIRDPINENVTTIVNTLRENIGNYVRLVGSFLADQVLRIINTITFLIGFLIIPIWLFYVLNDQDEGKRFLNAMLHPRLRPDFWNVWGIINRVFSDYIRGQLLLGLAVGVMVGVGLLILRLLGFQVRYILLLSIIAAITELVPIIGPIIGAIPGVIIGFLSPSDPVGTGLAVLLLYVIVQQLENNLLVPRIVGDSVGVHPAILTVVLIAMGQVFGLLGVILSAPLAAIARDLFLYIYRRLGGQSPDAAMRSISNVDKDPTQSAPEAQPLRA